MAASSLGAALRPGFGASPTELASLLRDGRLLAAEVLEASRDGNLILAIGRHRVPAESDVDLDPGRHLLLRVSQQGGGWLLHVVGEPDVAEPFLLAELRKVVGEQRSVGELLAGLAARLRASAGTSNPLAPSTAQLAASLSEHILQPGAGGAELRRLLSLSGLRYEAALAHWARDLDGRQAAGGEVPDSLRSDLKAKLLKLLAGETGAMREAVERVLRALETEQLLGLARRQAGEPFVWSLPVPDGDTWSTAQLVFHPGQEPESGQRDAQEEADGDGGFGTLGRVTLRLELSRLGPLQLDLELESDVVTLRVLAARQSVIERLQRDFEELQELAGGRRFQLFARLAESAEVEQPPVSLDIRFLRENRLLDVQG